MSSDEKSSQQQDFQPIDEIATIRRHLFQGAKNLSEATVATQKNEYVARMMLVGFDEKSGDIFFQTRRSEENDQFREQLEKTASARCIFNVSVPQASLFFITDFLGEDAVGFKFACPQKVFSAHRRKHMRLTIPLGYKLKIETPDPLQLGDKSTRLVFDISEGGLSFFAEPEETESYPMGMVLPVEFKLKGNPLKAVATIRHARLAKTREGKDVLKVGIEFNDPPQEMRDEIVRYIFDEQSRRSLR